MTTHKQRSTIQPDDKNVALTNTIPTILYDSVNRIITVEVVVARLPLVGTITILASPVIIPRGTWAVHWELHVITLGLEAYFDNPGVVILNLPPNLTVVTGPSGTGTMWTVQLKNDGGTTLSFPYEITIKSGAYTTKKQVRAAREGDPVPVIDPPEPPPKKAR